MQEPAVALMVVAHTGALMQAGSDLGQRIGDVLEAAAQVRVAQIAKDLLPRVHRSGIVERVRQQRCEQFRLVCVGGDSGDDAIEMEVTQDLQRLGFATGTVDQQARERGGVGHPVSCQRPTVVVRSHQPGSGVRGELHRRCRRYPRSRVHDGALAGGRRGMRLGHGPFRKSIRVDVRGGCSCRSTDATGCSRPGEARSHGAQRRTPTPWASRPTTRRNR